jgi:hypothetical protein
MSHAMVNVDVTENAPTAVSKSRFGPSVGVWVDGDVSLHFRDAGHLGTYLGAFAELYAAMLAEEGAPPNCVGSELPEAQEPVGP